MRSLALGCTGTAKIRWMKLADTNHPFLYWKVLRFHLLPPFTQPSPSLSHGVLESGCRWSCQSLLSLTKVQRESTLLKR